MIILLAIIYTCRSQTSSGPTNIWCRLCKILMCSTKTCISKLITQSSARISCSPTPCQTCDVFAFWHTNTTTHASARLGPLVAGLEVAGRLAVALAGRLAVALATGLLGRATFLMKTGHYVYSNQQKMFQHQSSHHNYHQPTCLLFWTFCLYYDLGCNPRSPTLIPRLPLSPLVVNHYNLFEKTRLGSLWLLFLLFLHFLVFV
jgi:hypothetical protein